MRTPIVFLFFLVAALFVFGCDDSGGDSSTDLSDQTTSDVVEDSTNPDTSDPDTSDPDTSNPDTMEDTSGCTSDTECPTSTPICQTSTGDCVECIADLDCGSGFSCESNECIEDAFVCSSDADCTEGDFNACDTASGNCVECVSDSHCETGYSCESSSCVMDPISCSSDADCTEAGLTHCDLTAEECVECTEDSHCGTDEVCNSGSCFDPNSCDHDGFVHVGEYAIPDEGTFYYGAYDSDESPYSELSIEFYYGMGDPEPLTGPGTFELGATEDEQNYQTCGTCVLVYQGCNDEECTGKTFFATSGTLTLSEFGGTTYVGSLTDVTLQEVTIDTSTWLSTPVSDGETWCIDNFTMDTQLANLECETDEECTEASAPICDTTSYQCVECTESSQCSSGSCLQNTCVGGSCDINDFTEVGSAAYFYANNNVTYYDGWSSDSDPFDSMSLELFFGAGAPTAAGTYPLASTAAEQDYYSCSTCVLFAADCTDGGGCEKFYFPTGGTLELTSVADAVGEAITGTITDLELVEVTIDETYHSTPVTGGETWCVDSYSFDATTVVGE